MERPGFIVASLAAAVLTIALGSVALAAPSISSTSGTFTHDSSVTISGSNFGTKSTAAPIRYDDFDDGEVGSNLSWWSLDGSSSIYPKYSDTRSHNSDQCARANFESQYNCTAYKSGYDLDEVYLSYWVYWAKVSGDDSRNIKLARITSDTDNYKTGTPSLGYTGFYTTSSIWYAFNGDADGPDNDVQVWGDFVSSDSWHRIELYGKISTINQDDGARGWWLDLSEVDYDDTFATYTSSTDRDSYRCLVMPLYVAHDAGGPHNIYYDDVYFDNTLARVEIGNASTWSNCTHREHQVPSAWSSSSITATVNTGNMSNGTAYLYVVDANGDVNSSGYQVTIGSGATYTLTVNSGTGGGNYAEDAVADIDANAAPSGQDFDEWIGDTSGIASVTTADTTLTMPAANSEITATYTDKTWTLTVNSGTGGGNYAVGAIADIDADSPASGKQFDEWIGDTSGIASVTTADTTLTMPYANAQITATYEDAEAGTTYLIVDWEDSENNSVFDFSDWDTVFLGSYTSYTSTGPDGLIGSYSGTGVSASVSGTSATFSQNEQIKVTWYNSDTGSHTITPKISFDDDDWYNAGTSGTWYDMTQLQCSAASSGTTTYTFTSQTAGNYDVVNVCRFTSGADEMIMDKIEYVAASGGSPTTYTLTVNSGTGDGDYAEAATPTITADAAPSGQDFDEWVGDTAGIASVTSSSTTLTMPAANAEVTATYTDKTWTLTVNNGSGDGSYVVGAIQGITADAAPSGQDFDEWTGDVTGIANVNNSTTTITMPYANAEITATYTDKTWTLTVNNGTGDGSYVVGAIQGITADAAPSGQDFDEWTGDVTGIADVDDSTTTITMPYANAEVTATYTDKTWTLTVNSGTGDGSYAVGAIADIDANAAPSGYVFDQWVGDTAGIASVTTADTTLTMPYGNAEITATYEANTYTLTVNSGSGDGDYSPSTIVDIDADAAASGKLFDAWTGDTATISDVNDPSGTLTMPSSNAEITATYTWVASGLVSRYTFDTDARDTYGSNDGTLTNGAAVTNDGTRGAVVGLDGSDDVVSLPTSGMTGGRSEMTLAMWIRPDETVGTNMLYDAHYNWYWQFAISQTTWYTRDSSTGTGGSRNNDLSLPSLSASQWQHLAFVYSASGDKKAIYLDGVESTSSSTSVDALTSDRGGEALSAISDGTYYDGLLDDVRLYSRALNDTEIARLAEKTFYTLTVNSGSGDGDYIEGQVADISADAAPSGQDFDEWVGDTTGIASVTTSGTTLTMPAANAEITATYTDKTWTLTVNSGSGDGSYAVGAIADIDASAAPSGQEFDEWVGDTAGIASVTTADTTLTMPYANAEITATYTDSGPTVTLIVNWGSSAGNNVYDFSDWGDPFLGTYTTYSSLGPDGLIAGWTGTGLSGCVDGSSESFSEGDVIKVTWYNSKASSITFTPKISFDDPNYYGGTPGTWYDMTQLQCAAESTGTTTYTFTGGTAGSYSLVNVCRYTNGANEMVMDKIELEQ